MKRGRSLVDNDTREDPRQKFDTNGALATCIYQNRIQPQKPGTTTESCAPFPRVTTIFKGCVCVGRCHTGAKTSWSPGQ